MIRTGIKLIFQFVGMQWFIWHCFIDTNYTSHLCVLGPQCNNSCTHMSYDMNGWMHVFSFFSLKQTNKRTNIRNVRSWCVGVCMHGTHTNWFNYGNEWCIYKIHSHLIHTTHLLSAMVHCIAHVFISLWRKMTAKIVEITRFSVHFISFHLLDSIHTHTHTRKCMWKG